MLRDHDQLSKRGQSLLARCLHKDIEMLFANRTEGDALPYGSDIMQDIVLIVIGLFGLALVILFLALIVASLIAVILLAIAIADYVSSLVFSQSPGAVDSQKSGSLLDSRRR